MLGHYTIQVNSLIVSSSVEQQRMSGQRESYRKRIGSLELQLLAVVKAFDQLEAQVGFSLNEKNN